MRKMSSISKIKIPDGTQYSIKDDFLHPINLTSTTVDLNSYTLSDGTERIKYYYCSSLAGGNSITHKPNDTSNATTNEFFLTVKIIRYINTTDYKTKQIYESKDGNVWTRICTNGNWGNWIKNNILTDELESHLLTNSDIVVCTQSEYDAMQTRTGLLYFIKEEASS